MAKPCFRAQYQEGHRTAWAGQPEALWAIYQLSRTSGNLAAFQRAAELSDRPAVLAAYADSLVSGLSYYRRDADPGDAAAVAAEAADNARFHFDVTKPLSQTETSKLLDALGRWERAIPVTDYRLRLRPGRSMDSIANSEARMLWVKAAGYPVVDFHALELSRTARELLEEAGLPEPEAGLLVSASAWRLASALRTGARMASYEGRLAQLTGRPQEAARLWTATAEVGHKVEESASGWTAFWVGVAIESIGAAPTWAWYSDGYTGLKHGLIYGGRVVLGPQHSFYVSQVGQTSDAALRDRMLQGKMRSAIMLRLIRSRSEPSDRLGRAAYLLCVASLVAVQLFAFAVLFVALASWERAGADRATGLRVAWQVVIAAVVLPIPAAGAMIALHMRVTRRSRQPICGRC